LTVSDDSPGSPQTIALTGIGGDPMVTLSPTNINFGNQTVGVPSNAMSSTLTNTGAITLTINSIVVVGANGSDFVETNNCGTSVAPGDSCYIAVTFTPAAAGAAAATVSISDNAPSSPQTLPLTGVGVLLVGLSPPLVIFPSQYVGTSGLPQTVTVTNTGTSTLTITNVATSTADFGTLSNCTNSVQPGMNCTIGVFFDPTTSGTITGSLLITDNAGGSPQTVALSGSGEDFSMAPSGASSATVSPGGSATYTVSVTPNGGFNQTVELSCSGAPSGSTCSVSPSSVVLNGTGSSNVKVTVTTLGASAAFARPTGARTLRGALALWALPGTLTLTMLIGIRRNRSRKVRSRCWRGLALLGIVSLGISMPACGGGGSGGGVTPPGTYNLAVTGNFTSGATTLNRSTELRLTVQ
jgi:hypothetical protein